MQTQTFSVSGCNNHTFGSSATLSRDARFEEASVTFPTNSVIFRSLSGARLSLASLRRGQARL